MALTCRWRSRPQHQRWTGRPEVGRQVARIRGSDHASKGAKTARASSRCRACATQSQCRRLRWDHRGAGCLHGRPFCVINQQLRFSSYNITSPLRFDRSAMGGRHAKVQSRDSSRRCCGHLNWPVRARCRRR